MASNIHKTKYWHKLDEDRVQCDLCPRFCKLREGQRGLCFVRENQGGEIVLTTWGRSSGFCVDPVEKKPLNHFLPGTPVLSFGTAGCNLACKFCQNWDISKSKEIDILASEATPTMIADVAKMNDCRSVAFTYNDPVIFHEYAIETAQACREQGINSVAVTAGYICEKPREEFFRYMDAANIDLKAFDEDFYWKLTGAHLQPVLDTLQYVKNETDTWMEITTLLIPGENDSEKEITQMCEWIVEKLGSDVPLHFSAFHPDWKMKTIPPTPAATLEFARAIAIKAGLNYVYTGNIHDTEGGSTWCPGCGQLLIERDWYELGSWHLKNGHCDRCGKLIPGVFEDKPGDWGAKRMPIRMPTSTIPVNIQ
ncbi:MAG TPA: AmmeMemoRadiSam system radical SAM enzyme [Aeromonadales bacterium]|nr:AmmeMemoRadiSam system radical SAM enzyme [Aeromonadales bacterium]